MDDRWVIQQQALKQLFLDHINSIDPNIKFTVQRNQENGAIPFLDTLVKPEADNSLSIRVSCKPTHTDQYLQWDSHYNLAAKYSVIGTLTHRAKFVCTTPELLNEELQHLKEALARCTYPRWAINKVQNKVINGNWEENGNNHVGYTAQGTNGTSNNSQASNNPGGRPTQGHMVIPYVQGLGEASSTHVVSMGFQHILKVTGPSSKYKDKHPKEKKSGVIYCYQCVAIDCGKEYIGETSRTLGERYKEHLREPSTTSRHTAILQGTNSARTTSV